MKHQHTWGISKRYSPKSYKETCSCGAWRRVTEIVPGLREYEYPSGYKRRVKV